MKVSLPNIRIEACKKGYSIEYPGIYCKKAFIIPTYRRGEKLRTIEIDMTDPILGLQNLDAMVALLPNKSNISKN